MRTFYLKNVPAKFQIYLKHISWVISVTSSSKLSCNPRHPSRNISCNHRHHLLQPSWRRIFSASNNQKTRVDSDIKSDYRASSFDRLYIWCRKWDTVSFVRAHQRKYWNALTFGRGHDDDGCSCNHRAVPPSVMELNHIYAKTTAFTELKIYQLHKFPTSWLSDAIWRRESCSALVYVVACHLFGTKSLPEPTRTSQVVFRIDTLSHVKLLSGECRKTSLMISHHWLR